MKTLFIILMSIGILGCSFNQKYIKDDRKFIQCDLCHSFIFQEYYVRNDYFDGDLCYRYRVYCDSRLICNNCYRIMGSHLQRLFDKHQDCYEKTGDI